MPNPQRRFPLSKDEEKRNVKAMFEVRGRCWERGSFNVVHGRRGNGLIYCSFVFI